MRVAIVHDWLVTWRGGEKVLEEIATLYPDAPIFTLFCNFQNMPSWIQGRQVVVHPVANRLRFARKALLPFMPIWIESMDLSGFDLVISTSSCVAKGVIPDPTATHVSYIHSPMRYLWDQRLESLGRWSKVPLVSLMVHGLSCFLRVWDAVSTHRVDLLIANSTFVQKRIKTYYGRESTVLPPPVSLERFTQSSRQKKDYYLIAGAMVSYKRFDLAVKACKQMGRSLIVAGHGPELNHLKELSAGSSIQFIESPNDETWVRLMSESKGFLFPGVEDFGITAIEAMASGTPLIARRQGGALDFVVEGKTGVFFQEATVESLIEAIQRFESMTWDPELLISHTKVYGRERFRAEFARIVHSAYEMKNQAKRPLL